MRKGPRHLEWHEPVTATACACVCVGCVNVIHLLPPLFSGDEDDDDEDDLDGPTGKRAADDDDDDEEVRTRAQASLHQGDGLEAL